MKVFINILLGKYNIVDIDVNKNIYVYEIKQKVLEKYKINILNENFLFNKIKKLDNDVINIENLQKDYEILVIKNFSHK